MKKSVLSMFVAVALLSGCAIDPYTGESKVSNTGKGAGIGALAGAGIGALVGGEKGALIGAGIGAAGGAGIGGYMDVQARKLRQELAGTGVQVSQQDGRIYLIMPGNITFDSSSANIKPSFQPVLDSVSKVIKEYNKTMVQVAGYTDNTGSAATNNALSLRRANSVANYLRLRGVDGNRIITDGLGSDNPIAPNTTVAGREQNRRVEIALINKK